jgi:hypothetical protein
LDPFIASSLILAERALLWGGAAWINTSDGLAVGLLELIDPVTKVNDNFINEYHYIKVKGTNGRLDYAATICNPSE